MIEKLQTEYKRQSISHYPDALNAIIEAQIRRATSPELTEREVSARFEKIKKYRTLGGYDLKLETESLIEEIQRGVLQNISENLKIEVFSKLATFHAYKEIEYAEKILTLIPNSTIRNIDVDFRIAQAHIKAARSKNFDAVVDIGDNDTKFATARLCMAMNIKQPDELKNWINATAIEISGFCSFGKHVLISFYIESKEWSKIENSIGDISDDDIIECPTLNHDIAFCRLFLAMPSERRDLSIRDFYLIHPRSLAFHETKGACDNLFEASEKFSQFSNFCLEAEQKEFSLLAALFSTMLSIANPNTREQGIIQLNENFNDENKTLYFLPLAFDYGLKFDISEVEKLIAKEFATTNNKSVIAAFAWLALALNEKDSAGVYLRLQKYREITDTILMKEFILAIEIEVLAKLERFEEANLKLEELKSSTGLSEKTTKLEALIKTLESGEPAESLFFSDGDTIQNAKNNIQKYRKLGDLKSSAEQAEILFNNLKTRHNLKSLCDILLRKEDYLQIVELLKEHIEFLNEDTDLKIILAEANYYLGNFIDVAELCKSVLNNEHDYFASERLATCQLAIGDWDDVEEFVSTCWERRNNIGYQNILRAADLAVKIQSKRAVPMIEFAAEIAFTEDDAQALVSAYSLATSIGYENDNSWRWMCKAIELSGDDGPVQTKDLSFILENASSWSENVSRADQLHRTAQVPYIILSSYLNRTVTEFYLWRAMLNHKELNAAKKTLILSHPGTFKPCNELPKTVAVDLTTIYILYLTGYLDLLFDLFENVFIAHSTLTTMFDDLSKIRHHQPSQIRRAKKIVELFASSKVKAAPKPSISYHNLALDIGGDIASMLVETKFRTENQSEKAYVVTSYPVTKRGISVEVVDVTNYEPQIIGCSQIVEYLYSEGIIENEKYERCVSFLRDKNASSPLVTNIEKNVDLFIDSVSWSYIEYLNLIDELVNCGFGIFIDESELTRSNLLIEFNNQCADLERSIYYIAKEFSDRIKSGKVKLLKRPEHSKISDFQNDLVIGLLENIEQFDAIIFDDRAINKIPVASNNSGISKPIITSIDVLNFGKSKNLISEDNFFKSISKLRTMNFALIPVSLDEVLFCVRSSKISDKLFKPSQHFKALYSNLKSLQTTKELIVQEEIEFVLNASRSIVDAIRSIWVQYSPDEAVAISNKLLELLDLSLWSGALRHTTFNYLVSEIPFHIIMLYYGVTDLPNEIKESYWNWVDREVISPFMEYDKYIYSKIATFFEPIVSNIANEIKEPMENHG